MTTALYFGGQTEPVSRAREQLYCTRSGLLIADEYVLVTTQRTLAGIITWWQCPLCNRWHQHHEETIHKKSPNR